MTKRDFWLKVALPVVLLSLVPILGTVYAMVGDFAASSPAKSDSSARASASKKKDGSAGGSAELSACCDKLRELGSEGDLDKRPTYLAAAEVCENAVSAKSGFKAVKSVLKTDYQLVPSECQE